MTQLSVLIVDDEPLVRTAMSRMIARLRPEWQVAAVADPRAATEALRQSPFEVIVCDHHLERAKGADYLRQVAEEHPEMIRILASGRPDAEREASGCSHGFFPKPPDSPAQLIELIERLVEEP
jgi:DNA-binding NtrC family response regulator